MVKKKIYERPIHREQSNYYLLVHEKTMLENSYDFIDCNIKAEKGNQLLVVFGHYNQTGVNYSYKIVYDGYNPPKVWILSPDLVTDPPHIYEDKSLCLYYPKEQPWKYGRSSLYSHIIPWTMNGFFFTRYGRLLVYGNILKLIMDCLQKYDMLVDYVQGEIEPT